MFLKKEKNIKKKINKKIHTNEERDIGSVKKYDSKYFGNHLLLFGLFIN